MINIVNLLFNLNYKFKLQLEKIQEYLGYKEIIKQAKRLDKKIPYSFTISYHKTYYSFKDITVILTLHDIATLSDNELDEIFDFIYKIIDVSKYNFSFVIDNENLIKDQIIYSSIK